MGKDLNLKNPKDFNEKIQWLIVNKYGRKEAKYADKIAVRDYIKEIGCENLLTKLYGTYNNFDEIDFDKLPEKFVLKTNHDCGSVVICKDKSLFNKEEAKAKLNKSLKRNFTQVNLEYHYKYIKPMIMCEEYIDDGSGKIPTDYKFFCFNGNPECVRVGTDRDNLLRLDYYDLEWNYLDYSNEEDKSEKKLEKPKNLNEMVEIAKKLSKPFQFVRADLYDCNGKIYFGELTLTPSAGLNKHTKQSALDYFGSLIDIK